MNASCDSYPQILSVMMIPEDHAVAFTVCNLLQAAFPHGVVMMTV